jgi:hypothetical protein
MRLSTVARCGDGRDVLSIHRVRQWGETVLREADRPTIAIRDAVVAEQDVNDELDRRFFSDRYEKATEAEAIYMAAMADLGDGRHFSTEIAAHMRPNQNELSVRRAGLIAKGLIYNPVGTHSTSPSPNSRRISDGSIRSARSSDPAQDVPERHPAADLASKVNLSFG